EPRIGWKRELGDDRVDLSVDGPAPAGNDLALERLHLAQRCASRRVARKPLVCGDALDLFRHALANEIAHETLGGVGKLLAQRGDAQPGGNLDFTVVRLEFGSN